jgi:hypothetical protein
MSPRITHPALLPVCAILVLTGTATAADDGKTANYSFIKDLGKIRDFERAPTGWKAACGSEAGWRGTRGFTAESRASKETGILWFSNGKENLYRGIKAPRGAPHVVCEGQFSADHTQVTALDAHPRVKANDKVPEVAGSFDITVCFADDGTAGTRDIFNSFFQIFERSQERGWCPAYGLFFHKEGLRVGGWDDNPFVPGVRLERGKWYRVRFDVSLRNDGGNTLLSIWPVAANGVQGKAIVSGLMIEHKRGLRHPGLARSFPVMAGSYTWSIRGKDPVSAATLICAFSQSATLSKSK